MVLTALGVYQTAVTVFVVALAIRIWRVRSDRFQNVSLALLLALLGVSGFGSQGLIRLTTDYGLARFSQMLLYSTGAASPFVYLAFIGTLSTALARPLSAPVVRRLLLMAAAAVAIPGLVSLQSFVELVQDPVSGLWLPEHTPLAFGLWYFMAALVLYGFIAALAMVWEMPRGSPLRTQAMIYAAAFGIRDAWFIAAIAVLPFMAGSPLYPYHFPTLTLVFTALLGYGILRYQLLDIDLKIKKAIGRATVATIFAASFFVAAVTAENFLTDRYGWVVGGVAAGLLLFALTPLQRFSEHVADRAMPHVRDDSEYRLTRQEAGGLSSRVRRRTRGRRGDREGKGHPRETSGPARSHGHRGSTGRKGGQAGRRRRSRPRPPVSFGRRRLRRSRHGGTTLTPRRHASNIFTAGW